MHNAQFTIKNSQCTIGKSVFLLLQKLKAFIKSWQYVAGLVAVGLEPRLGEYHDSLVIRLLSCILIPATPHCRSVWECDSSTASLRENRALITV